MAIITSRYKHMTEFLLLRSLAGAPFRLLVYACLSACFVEILFTVFGLGYLFYFMMLPCASVTASHDLCQTLMTSAISA